MLQFIHGKSKTGSQTRFSAQASRYGRCRRSTRRTGWQQKAPLTVSQVERASKALFASFNIYG